MIIIVFGLPGSGKSFFASRLAEKLEATYINTDRLRKKLVTASEYDENEKEYIYEQMLERGETLSGEDLVLDGTFYREDIRKRFRQRLGKYGQVHFVEIQADEDIIKDRLNQSRPYSDADFGIYQKIKEEWAPPAFDHLILQSTDDNIDEMLSEAIKYLKG